MDPDYDAYGMHYDEHNDPYRDSQEEEDQTQTQSTQQNSQSQTTTPDSHLWGYLIPCSPALNQIDFWKMHPRYSIGRNPDLNQVVLPGFKVSNTHCTITWDGRDAPASVVVLDLSSNGTFINGDKIGKNQSRILNDGNEIAFGTCIPQATNNGLEDYRFIYRHTASGPPTQGLYAHYDIGTELGKGSFATVRRAFHRMTGQWFAVKMIYGGKVLRQGGQSSRTSTFAREISIMEKLEHPNICQLKEVFFQDDNGINLVLELVEGGDLLEYILKHGGLDEPNARDITYQMCDALAYIHSKGVTHRDLKPENVLLTRGEPPMVKVADFGLAKVVDSLTMLRTMCGTPSYLAPEVVEQNGRDGYDNLVDSWSVGVIVFSMITNSAPFLEDDTLDIKTRILQRQVDWGNLTRRRISNDAYLFIRGLLEENPRRRLSLTDSLQHVWLRDYVPFHSRPTTVQPGVAEATMVPEEDNIDEMEPVADIPPSQGRRVPLQRRSLVVSQAAEGGNELPEPSVEMIAYATSRDENDGVDVPAARGPNKRLRADLTPLSEEGSDGVEASTSGSAASSRGRAGPSEVQPRRSTRRTKVARMT